MKQLMIGIFWTILSLAIWISFAHRAARVAFQAWRQGERELA